MSDHFSLTDSWKGYSAIGLIILSPFTRLRKVVLEILLLEGADADAGLELCMEHGNSEVMEFLLNWETGGREKGSSSFLSFYSLAVRSLSRQ